LDDIGNTTLYRQLQATKSAALRIGPLNPNRRDSAFIRYQLFAQRWSRVANGEANAAD
jgi:hypothetical protein